MQINALPCRWGKDLFKSFTRKVQWELREREKLVISLEVKPLPTKGFTSAHSSLILQPSAVFRSQLVHTQPPKIQQSYLISYPISFWLQQLLLQDSLAWLWFVVFPCIGVIVPCDFTSRMGPRKVINLQFVQIFFFLVRVGMIISKLPTCPR